MCNEALNISAMNKNKKKNVSNNVTIHLLGGVRRLGPLCEQLCERRQSLNGLCVKDAACWMKDCEKRSLLNEKRNLLKDAACCMTTESLRIVCERRQLCEKRNCVKHYVIYHDVARNCGTYKITNVANTVWNIARNCVKDDRACRILQSQYKEKKKQT